MDELKALNLLNDKKYDELKSELENIIYNKYKNKPTTASTRSLAMTAFYNYCRPFTTVTDNKLGQITAPIKMKLREKDVIVCVQKSMYVVSYEQLKPSSWVNENACDSIKNTIVSFDSFKTKNLAKMKSYSVDINHILAYCSKCGYKLSKKQLDNAKNNMIKIGSCLYPLYCLEICYNIIKTNSSSNIAYDEQDDKSIIYIYNDLGYFVITPMSNIHNFEKDRIFDLKQILYDSHTTIQRKNNIIKLFNFK